MSGRLDRHDNALAWTIDSRTWAVEMTITKHDALERRRASASALQLFKRRNTADRYRPISFGMDVERVVLAMLPLQSWTKTVPLRWASRPPRIALHRYSLIRCAYEGGATCLVAAEKLLKSVPITTDGDEYRWAGRLLASSVGGS